MSVLIIAEAGVNHNGNEQLAFELVDAASASGADIVKFQTFKARNLVTKTAQQCSYQAENIGQSESQFSMLKRLELPIETHFKLLEYCEKKNIKFLSTAFDSESLAFLVNDIKLPLLKLPSGEITNAPFLLEHAKTGCELILSTGMATLEEVENALGVLAFGLLGYDEKLAGRAAFAAAYNSVEGKKALRDKVTLLHCTTEYPAPMDSINLRAMDTLKNTFELPVGYSDHSAGTTIPIAAVARGAVVIEKHFTLDRNLPGPDHKASLEPNELATMVQGVRDVERALGTGEKKPSVVELKNLPQVRKSVVAAASIAVGESFSKLNLQIKRPGSGVSPYDYWQLLQMKADKEYCEGELIEYS
ncbi:N-acetylneuraminate synthase [Halodesulfovibrio marinisediminis]|uniref:N-acetylneuraminate synthase n=1 Tax=Halodesulfovibrio marinisediminis DSM 17456 TaxID=1121457 RepID=A0A1N6FTG0_9BACT|nr:N-acetylneuraminate synthase [Halodesulfovibrio marinisediminis]SIN98554.1 N-acetylneuraminate synthase [Halodesulfovibrio marinisediminis DSM 17456]